MADALYVTGRFHTREIWHGDTRVRLVTSDFDERALGAMSDLVRGSLTLGERELGPVPAGDLLVIHDRNPMGVDGSVTGRAISIVSESGPSGRARADDGIVLVHELVHLWNRSDTWWINEGFARWWELRLSLLLDNAPPSEFREALSRIFARYLEEASGRTVEASEGSFGYAAGALVAFCAETRLRQSETSLGLVHRTAREASDPSRTSTIDREAFLAALGAAVPAARTEVEEMLAATGPIEFGGCFERAGFRLTANGELVDDHGDGFVNVLSSELPRAAH